VKSEEARKGIAERRDGMPISIALLLGIPIGLLFCFEARWLIRYAFDRHARRERITARFCGVCAALLIPLVCCFGLIEGALPGRLGMVVANGTIVVDMLPLVGSIFATPNERK
jgi:hypothetical protein